MPSQLLGGKERGLLFCVLTVGSFPYLLSPGLSKEITPKSAGLYRVCSKLKEKLCNFFPLNQQVISSGYRRKLLRVWKHQIKPRPKAVSRFSQFSTHYQVFPISNQNF